ncbi:glutamine amidotransferase [Amycolatopsis acidicola]|uniref:Lipid II isoglutaminyl synthase (glutamine-hydrolyzing) subunit GatD n=1 Tax=Amycolatopsis acidicola TaxID=2596893 RepID=A0A5N0UNF3_9PSEU|nr:glutamine amidotransferase [Amycolatopsis acidicola]KAA9150836.1 glutamine amidotransferase [Amycolatopsis acidicola]
MTDSTVHIGLILPDVLGTYGDSGNATVLAQRLRWRGTRSEIVPVLLGEPVPDSLDLYVLGGGEDDAQILAAQQLSGQPGLRRAVERGAPVFGVCAGLQVLGSWFRTSSGTQQQGLGLLDASTVPGRRRAVGEVVVRLDPAFGREPLTGFENHRGHTTLGPGSVPLGRVRRGTGNGDRTEGACTGRIVATYLHGPVLARNPGLADLLLGWVFGHDLPPLPLPEVAALRRARLGRRG